MVSDSRTFSSRRQWYGIPSRINAIWSGRLWLFIRVRIATSANRKPRPACSACSRRMNRARIWASLPALTQCQTRTSASSARPGRDSLGTRRVLCPISRAAIATRLRGQR